MISYRTLLMTCRSGKYRWVTATAIITSEELVKIQYTIQEEQFEEWVELESDKIMPLGTMVKNQRWEAIAEVAATL